MARTLATALLLGILVAPAFSQGRASSRTVLPLDTRERVRVPHSVHPLAKPGWDIGRANPNLRLSRIVLVLQPPQEVQTQLQQFLKEQQDPGSSNYHRWLTPQQFGERFGVPADQLAAVLDWLKSYGFTIDEIAPGGLSINFSGTLRQVELAFGVAMHRFKVNGRQHLANANPASIPSTLAGIVVGPLSLHDFRHKTMIAHVQSVPRNYYKPEFTSGSSHFLAPADFSTQYDLWALYNRGINGTGQSVAIVGRTDINLSDVQTFRNFFGLPANNPMFIHNGTAPGNLGGGEETEALLDVEWSGAVARNAKIKFVISASTITDGVDLSAQYIVNNNVAPVISTSFGSCEQAMGAAENAFWNSLWSQAAAQGQTAFVSSGDSGAAGCEGGSSPAGTVLAVNGLASTPFNVAVGGSQLNDTSSPGTYWAASNNALQGSLLTYAPEIAWNESGPGLGLWSTGGGVSTVYAKPVWQSGPGVPADGMRDVPDVSLSAAGHDGYIVQQASQCVPASNPCLIAVGGTSASSPSFAGLMAMVVQKQGARQGNANTTLYPMANSQYANNGIVAFHDVTAGNNKVPYNTPPPATIGYNTGTAYDPVTGVGTADAFYLVTQWGQTPTGSGGGPATITNGNFETGNLAGWTIGGTFPPAASTVQKHAGTYSALLGSSGATEPNGDSSISQTITLPGSFTSATLNFFYWPSTQDVINYDWQEAQVRDTSGNTLVPIFKVCSNARAWQPVSFDLTPYKGKSIVLYFNAHGDGYGDTTYMYLDDVTLTITP